MALVLRVKKNEQAVINGAVIENISQKTISILVKNEASILRSKDILTPDDAITPASRVYYALQCMYLFPSQREDYLNLFKGLADSYGEAAPSARPIITAIEVLVEKAQSYAALKKAQELIDHEGKLLADVQKRLAENVRFAAAGREPAADGSVGTDPSGAAHEGQSG